MRNDYGKFWGICCLVWLIGCASTEEFLHQDVTPEEILRIASTRLKAVNDFRCEAQVVVRSPDGIRQSALTAIVFRAPDQLRVEAMNFLGISLMTLLSRGDSVLFYLPSEHRIFETSTGNGKLDQFIGFDIGKMPPGAFFLGIPDMTGDDLQRLNQFSREGNRCVMRFKHRHGTREVRIDLRYIVVIEDTFYDVSGRLLGKRMLRDYRRNDKFYVPRQIEMTREGDGPARRADGGWETVHLRFISCQVNRGVADEVFKIHLPKGVIRESP